MTCLRPAGRWSKRLQKWKKQGRKSSPSAASWTDWMGRANDWRDRIAIYPSLRYTILASPFSRDARAERVNVNALRSRVAAIGSQVSNAGEIADFCPQNQ